MIDWYSEQTMDRLRRLLTTLRRQRGLSLETLAAQVGSPRSGPSASTLGRFLSDKTADGKADLSVRHTRQVLQGIRDVFLPASDLQGSDEFPQACWDDLAFFGLLGIKSNESPHLRQISDAQSADDVRLSKSMSGIYIIFRAFEDTKYISSLVEFQSTWPHSTSAMCRVHKIVRSSGRIGMDCDVKFINRLLYLKGFNPMNQTIRFMCFAPADIECLNFTGFLTGFETPGVSFASKAAMLKVNEGVTIETILAEVSEINDAARAVELIEVLSVNSGGAISILESLAQPSYAKIVPDYN